MIPTISIDPKATLVHHFLERSARLYPDKLALTHGKIRATYSQINGRANRFASHLLSLGLGRGDRVVILLENSLEYVITYYAILKAGGVAAPLNSDLKPEGIRYALRDLESKILVTGLKFEKVIVAADLSGSELTDLIIVNRSSRFPSSSMGPVSVADFDSVSSGPLSEPRESSREEDRHLERSTVSSPGACCGTEEGESLPIAPDDLASIIYTSGSTGGPKGVMLTHRNIVSNTNSICQYLSLRSNDIQMVVLPFFYVMGKSLLNTHFAVGGTVVINNRFAFPVTVLDEMVKEGCTGFSGVPSTFAYLLHRSPLAKYKEKLTSLRYCSQAGGHMARAVKEGIREILPSQTDIFVMYGATEASARLSYLDPSRFSDKIDSIGKAIPGVLLTVVNEKDEELPPGKVGELVARGDNIMKGYWKDPAGTERALRNGMYHTGDQAYRDEDGYFFVVGRKDELVKTGGHRVNLVEVEDVLMSSGLLVEVAVCGLPDELLGNKLVAVAVAKDKHVGENELIVHCMSLLPRFKCPSRIALVASLPKKGSGKIDRHDCLRYL